jgi:hypothetical protein
VKSDINVSSCTVRARKARNCESYPRCHRGIRQGEDYARHVTFPGSDVNTSTVPWVLHICATCQTEYGQEMPPRRRTLNRNRKDS